MEILHGSTATIQAVSSEVTIYTVLRKGQVNAVLQMAIATPKRWRFVWNHDKAKHLSG